MGTVENYRKAKAIVSSGYHPVVSLTDLLNIRSDDVIMYIKNDVTAKLGHNIHSVNKSQPINVVC